MLDLAGWAMVKQANMTLDPLGKAVGFDLTLSAPEIAKQVGEGFDVMGDAAFGKEQFSQGEALLGGMNAAQIGNLGGGIIGKSPWPAPAGRPRRARRPRRC